MDEIDLSNIELDVLIKSIQLCYGWDFSHYKKASLKRRIKSVVESNKLNYISDLIPKIIYDPIFFNKLVSEISIPVTEMFRDPSFFLIFRNEVIPILKTYPLIRIWDAGCADGKEVYSIAILLHEEGLYERTKIIGTDINSFAISKAKEGIYRATDILEYADNYNKSGGKKALAEYFQFTIENAIIHNHLKRNVSFKIHNMTELTSVGVMNVIFCRNVFIYFDKTLQEKIVEFFYDALLENGILCLGTKESLEFSAYNDKFTDLKAGTHIYRKLYQ